VNDDASTRIPTTRRASAVEYVSRRSVPRLVVEGLSVYVAIVVFITGVQLLLIQGGFQVVKSNGACVTYWLDLIYFNVVTVLTIGYGDYVPSEMGRVLMAFEALAGVGVFGTLVGVVVVKVMLPRPDSIVFSNYCYFDKDAQRFVVQFVNTTQTRLVNADMSSVLKLGRANWIVRPPFRTPYVGESGWTFSVNGLWEYVGNPALEAARAEKRFPQQEIDDFLSHLIIYGDDGLKFGISGSHGFSVFSAAKKYSLADCWVVESKDSMPVSELRDPVLGSSQFAAALNYIPDERQTFLDYARQKGATIAPRNDQEG
jgi:hypothetical protein